MANPATIIIGLFMGRSALKGEKERQLHDAPRPGPPGPPQVHRRGQLRGRARTPATRCAGSSASCATSSPPGPRSCTARPPRRWPPPSRRSSPTPSTRQKRLRDVDAELKRIGVLRDKAYALAPDLQAGHEQGSGVVTPPTSTPLLASVRAAARARRRRSYAATPAAVHRLAGRARPARRAAAGRHRRQGQGRQVDAAQRARRRGAGPHRRRRVHPHRHLVPRRHHLPGDARAHAGRAPPGAVHPRRRRHRRSTSAAPTPDDVDRLVIEWPSSSLRADDADRHAGHRLAVDRRVGPHHAPSSPRAKTRSPRPTRCST